MSTESTLHMHSRRALRLEYATIAWNVGEAGLTIALGMAASSIALVGFGTDSLIEIFASIVVVWHLSLKREANDPRRTAVALRLVAVAFGLLAVVLATVSIRDLLVARQPDESPWGIAYLALTAAVMFGLARLKRDLAVRLESEPLRSEARMTFLDGMLAAATMIGLALNAGLGWWWADPTAALLVGAAAGHEAIENWKAAG